MHYNGVKSSLNIQSIRQLCHIMDFLQIMCTSFNDDSLFLRFLIFLSNLFPSYKPLQGFRGPTQLIFVPFNDEVHGVIKKLTFEDEVMTKILATEVIPDNQGVMLEISSQVSGWVEH